MLFRSWACPTPIRVQPKVIYSSRLLVPLRASQVPRPIFPRALPPPTPRSPTTALARCFIAGSRLHHSLADWPLLLCVTRPKRVRLRCGSRVRFARLRQWNYSHSRLRGYLSNGQFTRYPPFRILDRPGLSWRSKDAEAQRNTRCHFDRREKSFSDPSHSLGMTGLGPSLSVLAPWRESSFLSFRIQPRISNNFG